MVQGRLTEADTLTIQLGATSALYKVDFTDYFLQRAAMLASQALY